MQASTPSQFILRWQNNFYSVQHRPTITENCCNVKSFLNSLLAVCRRASRVAAGHGTIHTAPDSQPSIWLRDTAHCTAPATKLEAKLSEKTPGNCRHCPDPHTDEFSFSGEDDNAKCPHWPKVGMGRSGGGAAFLRKAISRIGERNVEEEWDGNTNNICGWCRVFSNRSHRSNLGGGQGWNREWWEYAGGSGQCRRGLTCKLVVSPSMPPPQHNARSTSSPSWLCRYPPSSSNDP